MLWSIKHTILSKQYKHCKLKEIDAYLMKLHVIAESNVFSDRNTTSNKILDEENQQARYLLYRQQIQYAHYLNHYNIHMINAIGIMHMCWKLTYLLNSIWICDPANLIP